MGAYYQLLTPGIPELGGWVYMGPYTPEAYWFEFRGVLTNATPTDAYRGAGRPEATYVLERLVDAYARKIGKDPAEVRRMNFHPPFSEATTVHLRAQRRLGQLRAGARPGAWSWRTTSSSARSSGRVATAATCRQIGIGLSTYIEMCGLAPSNILGALRYAAGGWDAATIRCLPDRQGRRRDRHVAARPGTRDHVVADRGRRPGRDARRRRRSCTATRRSRRWAWTRTARGRSPSAASRCTSPWRRSRRRRARSRRTSWRCPRTTWSTPTARSA